MCSVSLISEIDLLVAESWIPWYMVSGCTKNKARLWHEHARLYEIKEFDGKKVTWTEIDAGATVITFNQCNTTYKCKE